ncbi:MAG: thiamine diphosphokinase [Porcipelethomonas sp.]
MEHVKKCYIFAGCPDARCTDISFDDDRYVICADGGYSIAKRLRIEPDVMIGDFDTYSGRLPENCEIIKHPPEKDDTDTMLAAKLALDRGYRHIVICGGVGGRLDHTIANIQTLRYILRHEAYGELAGDGNYVTMQGPGVRVYSRMKGYYFSVFSYTEECRGVSLTGFKYPLKDGVIRNSFPIGVSNEITGRSGIVSLESGILLVVFSRDMNQS